MQSPSVDVYQEIGEFLPMQKSIIERVGDLNEVEFGFVNSANTVVLHSPLACFFHRFKTAMPWLKQIYRQ